MEGLGMENDLIVQKILNNETVRKIFKISYYKDVYQFFEDYLEFYNSDFLVRRNIQNKLFIEYLKQLPKVNDRNNLYERMLVTFLNMNYTEDIIEYLLNKEFNMNYVTLDSNNKRVPLQYLLAVRVKDKKNMQLLLNKINTKNIFFRNGYYKDYNDLCRMNIIAGNLEEAFKVFNLERYKLINIDTLNQDDIIKTLISDKKITIDGYNILDIDLLSQVILTIKNSNIDILDKRRMLINILKSRKIKLFNIDNLKIIEEILESENYTKFLEYLRNLEENQDIILFNISKTSNDTMYYTNLDNMLFPKINVKKM